MLIIISYYLSESLRGFCNGWKIIYFTFVCFISISNDWGSVSFYRIWACITYWNSLILKWCIISAIKTCYQFFVLFCCKLFVITDLKFDFFLDSKFRIIFIVKFWKIIMFKNLFNRESFLRIELQNFVNQVYKSWIRVSKELFWCFMFNTTTLLNEFLSIFTFYWKDILRIRLSCELQNLLQLIDSWASRKHRVPNQNLSHNATNAPNVSFFTIRGRPKKDLRSSVPSCCNTFSHDIIIFICGFE